MNYNFSLLKKYLKLHDILPNFYKANSFRWVYNDFATNGQKRKFSVSMRTLKSSATSHLYPDGYIEFCGTEYKTDSYTNISPQRLASLNQNLLQNKSHPLFHLKKQIVDCFYNRYKNARGNPLFSIHEQLSPVVSTSQNFDSLLVPEDHVSRSKSDTYYFNKDYLLRAHMTAHQVELMKMGLDNFLFIGDVYRRDEIDSSHNPVFHQMDGVRLFKKSDVYKNVDDLSSVNLFQDGEETSCLQKSHVEDVVQVLSEDLHQCLSEVARSLFGKDVELRWVDAFFPFTHPSWELEIKTDDKWVEMLGCGIMKQEILTNAGITDKVGWAFGVGLERLAMKFYAIPDIRIFWSKDERFLSQFDYENSVTRTIYKPFSKQTPCINDISFWLTDYQFHDNDFYELVRNVGSDLIETVSLTDKFVHPKTKRKSRTYRIIYRSWDRTLTQKEVNVIHNKIEVSSIEQLGVEIR